MKIAIVLATSFYALVTNAQVVTSTTATANRSVQSMSLSPSDRGATAIDHTDQISMQVWGLTQEELQRAKLLLKGPRANFSVPNLSPIEALGIHARSDAERRKYAERFAKAQHEDTERVLAWAMAYQQATQQLYPNQKVIDFARIAPIDIAPSIADAANMPRSAIRKTKQTVRGR